MKSLVYESPVDSDEALVPRIAVVAGDIWEIPGVFANVRQSLRRRYGQPEAKPPVFSPRASLVLLYRPAEGMKGRVNLAQPEDRTLNMCCGSTICYHSAFKMSQNETRPPPRVRPWAWAQLALALRRPFMDGGICSTSALANHIGAFTSIVDYISSIHLPDILICTRITSN
ncbi:hypothetical protein TNCV_4838111 [Trichonephila clavipes]|nr:hypothetical protein TNCV_4838111 [Trichonephila clavipes]